jgi:hypothetical protein
MFERHHQRTDTMYGRFHVTSPSVHVADVAWKVVIPVTLGTT